MDQNEWLKMEELRIKNLAFRRFVFERSKKKHQFKLKRRFKS